jgi:glutamine cyclotransferase
MRILARKFRGWTAGILVTQLMLALLTAEAAKAVVQWPIPPDPRNPPTFDCRVVRTLPHDSQSFTQGLVFKAGRFYESSGLYGQSSLRVVEPSSGRVYQTLDLAGHYFAEGLAIFNNQIYLLTWKARRIFVYGIGELKLRQSLAWPFEGWGLTHNGQLLIISDGSDQLRFVDPTSGAVVNSVAVRDGLQSVNRLNELEYIEGYVWANVWKSDRIAVIAPASGKVVAWVSLAALERPVNADVANGIAYDSARSRLFVTGKYWDAIYEIKLVTGSQK